MIDISDQNALLANQNGLSEKMFINRVNGTGQPMGRIHSTKGIRWGINQSIEVNTDQLLLTSTGKDPNIISYRKAINPNASSKNNMLHSRLASAKISANKTPGNLVNSLPNSNVELNDRVDTC